MAFVKVKRILKNAKKLCETLGLSVFVAIFYFTKTSNLEL
jgi:hypothetical protein